MTQTKGAWDARVGDVMYKLLDIPEELDRALAALALQEAELVRAKGIELAGATRELKEEVATATMDAWASGDINGKSQKQRDVQLDAWLRGCAEVAKAKAQAQQVNIGVVQLEAEIIITKSRMKGLYHELRAAQSVAMLQAALLNGSVETEREKEGVTERW